MRRLRLPAILAAATLAAAAGARAQGGPYDPGLYTTQYVLDFGVGLQFTPKYPGADDYILTPYPVIEVGRFYLPVLGQAGKKTRGVFIGPSIRFDRERKASDDPSLTGTTTIPWALELGAKVGVRYDWLRAFVTLRQGFHGHTGQVGELGLDVIGAPSPRTTFSIGPRLGFASGDYMDTYFGVTPAEAAAGPLTPYDPSGGFMSAGVAAKASYALSERTFLHVKGKWNRLIGDAAGSPIVAGGSKNQFTVGLGLSHRFAFDLFR